MSAPNYYSDLIKMMEEANALLPSLNRESSEIIDKWVRISSDNITTLNRHLQSSGLSVGEKQRIQSIIAALATLHEKFVNHSVVGGSLQSTEQLIRWKDLENVFRNRIRTSVVINLQHLNLRDFLLDAEKLNTEKLTNIVTSEGNLKVNFVLACKFSNQTNDGTVVEIKYFSVKNEAILPSTDIKKHFLENVVDELLTKVEDFQERDSGWSLVEIDHLQVNINRYQPLSAGQSTFIPLPKFIQQKKAVLNIKNNDQCCFFWAVTAALYPVFKNSTRTSSYPYYESVLKCEGINCPTTIHDVPKFEKLNDLAINVYGLDDCMHGLDDD
ncbi:uncharacterized protein [Chelonus insularis]|uniref:uncharacterized protein n=1 Tax=Chelonus insularis TaxID=460826 RepID=UPI00158ADC49|nr:uncharacterized protein LOC118069993 [Chelonus insularis]